MHAVRGVFRLREIVTRDSRNSGKPCPFLGYSSAGKAMKRWRKVLPYCLASLVFGYFLVSDSLAVTIRSRAAVVVEAATGEILFSKNPEHLLPPASTAKLMTGILVVENEDLSKVTTISRNAATAHSLRAGFKEGEKVKVEGLLYVALLKSANDAAIALAEAAAGSEEQFVQQMNEKALSLGATDTKFINSTGLPGPGQHITALDLAKIMMYAMKLPKLKEIIGTPAALVSTEAGRAFTLRNTDKLLGAGEEVIGGKTGYTDSAKHCFVCVAEREKRLIIVALLGSPSRASLWRETETLIGKGFEKIAPETNQGGGKKKETRLRTSSFWNESRLRR